MRIVDRRQITGHIAFFLTACAERDILMSYTWCNMLNSACLAILVLRSSQNTMRERWNDDKK